MGHEAIVAQLGGALSVAEAMGSGLRLRKEEAMAEWSQAAKEEGMGGKTGSNREHLTQRSGRRCSEAVLGAPRAPLSGDKSSEVGR